MEEEEILESLGDKNLRRAVFEKVVKQYTRMLYWKIRRMVIDYDDANDVLQNTFLKSWTALDSFRGESKISTWLYKIAINESLCFLEKKKNTHVESLDDCENPLVGKLQSSPYIDANEVEIKLQKAILTLPDRQRLVFNLRYYDEMKYAEMSELLNTSESSLKASYHFAAKKVEEYLRNHD
ncbi:MAG TPA: RNA polymerase subunit sigma-70 [Porphyromonadaceae bacterium]|nr:RNA polymerase subunit sigma-70 [Porphyromonadaceae bacterium]